MTSSKLTIINEFSQDSALCDIDDLIDKCILVKGDKGGRSTSCLLVVS